MATGKKQGAALPKKIIGFALALHEKETQARHCDLIISLGHAHPFAKKLSPSAEKLQKSKSGLRFRFSLGFRLRLSNREVGVMEKLTQLCNPIAVQSKIKGSWFLNKFLVRATC